MKTDTWTNAREVYAPAEVEAVLRALDISVVDETPNDFLCLCPYHPNTDSPAFSVSKNYGYAICFNPSCAVGEDERLTLDKIVRDIKHVSRLEAKRFILLNKGNAGLTFAQKFEALGPKHDEELPEFPQAAINKMHARLMVHEFPAQEYMKGRGFDQNTLEFFQVGFAPSATGFDVPVYREHDMIMVPAYDHRSRPVGLVGRSIEGKHFKNYGPLEKGKGFRKSQIIWNLQNARKHETLILCESTFDGMRIHQAGYPNVGALLGGSLSTTQVDLINRHFSKVIIFTDNETPENGAMNFPPGCKPCLKSGHDYCQGHKPGRDLGMKIVNALPRVRCLWATYDDKNIYARGVKDATDMTDDEIRECMRNAISHFEYLDWVA